MRSDTQGVAGKTAGSRTYAQMDTVLADQRGPHCSRQEGARGAIQDRASITPYKNGNLTVCIQAKRGMGAMGLMDQYSYIFVAL